MQIFIIHIGPTETTVCSTYHKCTKKESFNIPIGKSIANYKNYIVSEDNTILPKGYIGELCIGGKGLTKGYLNNPMLSSEKFIVLTRINERVFKTGDLCRINEKNEIEFIGRKDEQIKIRGYRISLIEIEKMLTMYPLINSAFVIDFYDVNNRKKLCAYYTGDNSITKKEIKEYLKKVLPNYMIPDVYIKVDDFKMTINGKIDKNSLPNPNNTINKTKYIEPRTKIEKKLVDIWRNILNIEKMGIDDNLFDLGADSLSIIEFQTLTMNDELNINAQDIYLKQTIRKLAEEVENNISKIAYMDQQYKLINIKELKLNKLKKNIENILLTGATGFLGIHILNEILENTQVNVYCLIRGKDRKFAEQRLNDLYKFYFQKDLKNYKKRVKIVYGDITEENLGIDTTIYNQLTETIDTVIHTAATVKHYGNSNIFYKINVLGTKNVIEFCKINNASLHHISTISVSGQYTELGDCTFTENDFWIAQNYSDNEYIKSKFQAEFEVLKEIKNNDLYAKIYRVGNLTGRYSDGVFQKNAETNAFYKKIMTMIKLKIIPRDLQNVIIDFTPIDSISIAIRKLLFESKDTNVIYHLYNDKTLTIEHLINLFNELGFNIKLLSNEDINKLTEAENKQINELVFELYPTINKSNITVDNRKTDDILKELQFEWQNIDKQYLLKTINYVREVIS